MPKYNVYTADDLLPSSVPAGTYGKDNWDEALEHAVSIKGYVVLRTSMNYYVVWASPRLDTYRLMEAMVRSFDPALSDYLKKRVEDIKELVCAHHMSEVA